MVVPESAHSLCSMGSSIGSSGDSQVTRACAKLATSRSTWRSSPCTSFLSSTTGLCSSGWGTAGRVQGRAAPCYEEERQVS